MVTARAIRLGLLGLMLCALAGPALACPGRTSHDPLPIADDPNVDPPTMALVRITLIDATAGEGETSPEVLDLFKDMARSCPGYGARRMFYILEDRGRWWEGWIQDRIHYYMSVPTQRAAAFRDRLRAIARAHPSLEAEVSGAPISEIALRIRGEGGASFEARVSPWSLFDPGVTEPLKAPNGVFHSVMRLSASLPRERRAEFAKIEKLASAMFPSLEFDVASDAWPGYLVAR